MADRETTARAETLLGRAHRAREMPPATWPGRPDIEFRFRVLSNAEVQECHAAAFLRMKEIELELGFYSAETYEEEVINQILFRACRDPKDPHGLTLAVDAADLRSHSTARERAKLFADYRDVVEKADVDIDEIPSDVWQEILDLLKKRTPAACAGSGRARSRPS